MGMEWNSGWRWKAIISYCDIATKNVIIVSNILAKTVIKEQK